MDDFHFNHIGQSTSNQTFSFPRKRTLAVTPSLLSRMSGRDSNVAENNHTTEVARRSKSPKLARSQRNRIDAPHTSLSDRIQPLENRITPLDQVPVPLVSRISAQLPAGPTVALSRISPSASAGTIKLLESPPARPVSSKIVATAVYPTLPLSRPEPTPLQNLAVVAASRSPVPVPSAPATATLSLSNDSTGFGGTTDSGAAPHDPSPLHVDSPIPPWETSTVPARPISPTQSTNPALVGASEPSLASTLSTLNLNPNFHLRPSAPTAAPSAQADVPVHRSLPPSHFPPLVSPTKTDTPLTSSTKNDTPSTPRSFTAGTLAWSLAPLWEESEAQMREWAQVANERAQEHRHSSQSQGEQCTNGGKKRARECQRDGENVVVEPTWKKVKVSTGKGGPPDQADSQNGPIAVGSSFSRALSCSSSAVSISQPEPDLNVGCANEDPGYSRKLDAPATVEVDAREQKERDEAAEIRRMHLERELALFKREEEERIRMETAEKHRMMKEQELRTRTERELKEQKDKGERELQERERKLRDEVQKRRMEMAAQGQAKASPTTSTGTVPPLPSVPPSFDIGGPNTSNVPAIVPIHNHVSAASKVIYAPSLNPPVQNLQHPLPPRPLPPSGGAVPGPSKPSAPLVSPTSLMPDGMSNPAKKADKIVRVRPVADPAAPSSKNASTIGVTPATAKLPISGTAPALPMNSSTSPTAFGSVPISAPSTSPSQRAPSSLIRPMDVKQEAVEPQLITLTSGLTGMSASTAHTQTAPAKPAMSPTAPHLSHQDPSHVDTSTLGALSIPNIPDLQQRPKGVLMPSAPSSSAVPTISKALAPKPEPTPEPKLEPLSDLSLEMPAWSPSIIEPIIHPSGKRPRSASYAETADRVVKRRRDTSLESTMELTYPEATPETSGWGHVDLDQDEERRPGGRHRRPRTRTPDDASPAPDDAVANCPNVERTPLPPSRSRSRSPLRAGRGGRARGRMPRGPRGHGTGRAMAHPQIDRYALSQARGRSRSRTPPRWRRSPTLPRTYDHWSPRSPRSRTDSHDISNPYPSSYIPPIERGGPWSADRSYHPTSPSGAPRPRHDPKHPFAYRRQIDIFRPRASPERYERPHEPAPFRAPASTHRYDDLVPVGKRDIAPYVQPKAPNAHDLSLASSPSSHLLVRDPPFGCRIPPRFTPPENDGAPRYRHYPADRRTVSASLAQPHTNEMHIATPHASNHLHAPPPRPSSQPSQTLANRLSQDQRGIPSTGQTSFVPPVDAGGFEARPRRGRGNLLRGRGSVPRGVPGRTKLVARLSDAQSGNSLLKRVEDTR